VSLIEPMTTPAVTIFNVSNRFASQPIAAISELSYSLPSDRCLSLLGPSGCGKTTVLRLLMGLELPSSGSIEVHPALKKQMSYVFQEPRLVPWRTALENVLLPLELLKRKSPQQRERAHALLVQFGLTGYADHFPAQLSGGMQMRVALARALVTEPKLLLLDEPFAALDERTRVRLHDLLLELNHRLSLQFIFVPHSIAEAIYLGDEILLLNRHGQAALTLPVELGDRTHQSKLDPRFIDITRTLTQKFIELEEQAA